MQRSIFLALSFVFLLALPARANDSVDYASFSTLYESKLTDSASSSMVRVGTLAVSLYDGHITVWDLGDFSHPIRRGSLPVDPDALRLIVHRGECYLLARHLKYLNDGFHEYWGYLYWIDLSNPDSPHSTELYDTGYVAGTASWGDDLIFTTYAEFCNIPPLGNCWFDYSGTKVMHFTSPTDISVGDFGLGKTDDYMGSGPWLWVIHGDLLTVYAPTGSLQNGIERALPLGSKLISIDGDRAWIRTSSSTFESFRVTPDEVISERIFSCDQADDVGRIIPWQDGVVALGSFGVQVFGIPGSASSIWRVAQSSNSAITQNNRAWVASEITGIQQILLDPAVETPPKIGVIDEEYAHFDITADGHFLYSKTAGFLDCWDLQSPGGPQLAIRTSLGSTAGIFSISIQNDEIAVVYSDEVQFFRFNTTNGLPTFETGLPTQITARDGLFGNGCIALLSQTEGLEIHGLEAGNPLLSLYDEEGFANLQQLHVDGDMVWFLSGNPLNGYQLVGISISQLDAPFKAAEIPLSSYVPHFSVSAGDLITAPNGGTPHAYHYESGMGVSDLGEPFPSDAFEVVLLHDGILYTSSREEIRVYLWGGGSPALLGLQEGSGTNVGYELLDRGGNLAFLTADSHTGHLLPIYPAQISPFRVPVLVENFQVQTTGAQCRLTMKLAEPLPVERLRLIVLKPGMEQKLDLERMGTTEYQAWDEVYADEVSYRLMEKQEGATWIVLHEESVAGTTLSWVGPRILQNPASGSLHVAFMQARTGPVFLDVIDLAGRRIARLQSGVLQSGLHQFLWNGRDEKGSSVAKGVYFLRSQFAGHVSSSKFVWLR